MTKTAEQLVEDCYKALQMQQDESDLQVTEAMTREAVDINHPIFVRWLGKAKETDTYGGRRFEFARRRRNVRTQVLADLIEYRQAK